MLAQQRHVIRLVAGEAGGTAVLGVLPLHVGNERERESQGETVGEGVEKGGVGEGRANCRRGGGGGRTVVQLFATAIRTMPKRTGCVAFNSNVPIGPASFATTPGARPGGLTGSGVVEQTNSIGSETKINHVKSAMSK